MCFNPRSRKGNDDYKNKITYENILFQSTFPQGERQPGWKVLDTHVGFNPRSRKGNDDGREHNTREMYAFQSTFPQGERPERRKSARLPQQSFNPRSRKGNDGDKIILWTCREGVSIHVPARGTTHQARISPPGFAVSIHVPARGTTFRARTFFRFPELFQSTFPQGERRRSIRQMWKQIPVSIHVPARGTTQRTRAECEHNSVSIHVPARGTTTA